MTIKSSKTSFPNSDQALAQLARSDAIGSGVLDAALSEISEVAARTLDVVRVSIWMFDEPQSKIECIQHFQRERHEAREGEELFAADYPEYFRALKEQRTIAADDARNDPRTQGFGETYLASHGIVSLLDAPIYLSGEMVGVLCHEHAGDPRVWTLEEQHFAGSCADYVSLALEANRRRKMERSLVESEQQFRRAMYEVPCPVMIHAEDGEVRLVNNIWTELTGYTHDDIPTIYDWAKLAFGERKEIVRADIDRLFRLNHRIHEGEFSVRTKCGDILVWEFSSAPLGALADGRRLIVSVGIDVTDRKRAESSASRLADIVRSSNDAIIGKSLEGKIISWNNAAERLFGFQPVEVIDEHVSMLFPEEHRPQVATMLEHARQSRSFDCESVCVCKDGATIDVALSVSPIADAGGTVIGASTIVRDISGRKRFEEALRENEARLKLVLQQIPAILWTTDLDLKFTSSTGSGLAGLGLKPNQVVGTYLTEFFGTDDESLPPIAHSKRALQGESFEFEQEWADNVYQTYIAPLQDADENIIGTIGVALSITTRKRAEEELRRLNETLEDEVVERTATVRAYAEELKRQTAELERSNSELDQFVSIVTHDLRAPLRAVTSYCDLLASCYSGELDEKANEFLSSTLKAVHCMERLIDDLREYSRVQTHAKPSTLVSFEESLSDAIANLASEIRDRKARITHDELPNLYADGTQVMQLFQNLIHNGLKYCGKRPSIHVSAEEKDDEWLFRVKDNGIGVDPRFAERVFQVFVRIRSGDDAGSGLGLAICQRIVERHGGRIWVESDPEHEAGSTFCFTIPNKSN